MLFPSTIEGMTAGEKCQKVVWLPFSANYENNVLLKYSDTLTEEDSGHKSKKKIKNVIKCLISE